MHVDEFIAEIGNAPPAPIVLFCPAKAPRAREATFEPFLADRAVQHLIDATIDPANRDFSLTSYHADETKPDVIVGEAQTMPFLAERRVIFVRNAERYTSEAAAGALLPYLSNPAEFTTLLLITSKLDKRTKFYKACAKFGVIVECPMLNEREAIQWVTQEAELRGCPIERAAATELIGRTGNHLSDANNALTLVINFLGEGASRITPENVTAACADVAEEEIWALTDAIASSRTGKAVEALRNLVDLGKHPDEIIGTINWLLKNAYAVANATGDPGISRFVAQKVQPLADKLGLQKIMDAFALCTDTQFMMRTTGVDANLALDLLVIKLAAPGRRKSA